MYNFMKSYSKKLPEYEILNIFNCEETVLFWRRLNKMSVMEKDNTTKGKFSKERLNILFCVSGTGEK